MNWYKKSQNNRALIWSDPDWRGNRFPIFKNPNQADFDMLLKRYKDEYPNAPEGINPKTRFTYDNDGNVYRWMSGDGTHYHVEPFLKTKLNIEELSQNPSRHIKLLGQQDTDLTKQAGVITPNAEIVSWMAKQIKPYIHSLVMNIRIKELQKEILDEKMEAHVNPGYKSDKLPMLNEKLRILSSMPKTSFPSIMDNPEGIITMIVPKNIIPKDFNKLLRLAHKKYIKLVMQYRIKGLGGAYDRDYDDEGVAVMIDLMKIAKKEDPYSRMMQILNHELIHNIQHLESTVEYLYGMPSKDIATPEYTSENFYDLPANTSRDEREKHHSLLDSEFYPRISDRISALNVLRSKSQTFGMAEFKDFINKDSWLNILKKYAVGKYQKAVNEILKAFQTS